jgi:hypothetical protein
MESGLKNSSQGRKVVMSTFVPIRTDEFQMDLRDQRIDINSHCLSLALMHENPRPERLRQANESEKCAPPSPTPHCATVQRIH